MIKGNVLMLGTVNGMTSGNFAIVKGVVIIDWR